MATCRSFKLGPLLTNRGIVKRGLKNYSGNKNCVVTLFCFNAERFLYRVTINQRMRARNWRKKTRNACKALLKLLTETKHDHEIKGLLLLLKSPHFSTNLAMLSFHLDAFIENSERLEGDQKKRTPSSSAFKVMRSNAVYKSKG